MAYPKPLILFSLDKAILNANATKMKLRNEPTTKSKPKSKIAVDLKSPYNKKGIPKPKAKLNVNEMDIPKY